MNLYEILQNPDRVGEGMTHFERLFAQKVGGGKINEIFGVPPLRYIGDGRPLIDYLISGNTVQDGTPTPESPVPVVGCGTDTADGFKLSLTVNSTEYPIYLGQVETTRRIKKLVLTGEEDWHKSSVYIGSAYAYLRDIAPNTVSFSPIVCTHLNNEPYPYYRYGDGRIDENSLSLWLFNISATITDFKSYLAAQYANGTPVTVWCVLAEPETAVVNEPLQKIGDYADTISMAQADVTIPTVSGANVLDVPTEVPPSEIWIRGRIKEV